MRNRHRGFSLVELAVACGLLLVVLSTSVELVALVGQARRSTDQKMVAASEAANALERLMVLPWDQLTPQRAAEERLSDTAAANLHGGRLVTTLDHVAAEPSAVRIRVEIVWPDRAGQPPAQVRLTAWKYRHPSVNSAPGKDKK